jgi:hypothetical protein
MRQLQEHVCAGVRSKGTSPGTQPKPRSLASTAFNKQCDCIVISQAMVVFEAVICKVAGCEPRSQSAGLLAAVCLPGDTARYPENVLSTRMSETFVAVSWGRQAPAVNRHLEDL